MLWAQLCLPRRRASCQGTANSCLFSSSLPNHFQFLVPKSQFWTNGCSWLFPFFSVCFFLLSQDQWTWGLWGWASGRHQIFGKLCRRHPERVGMHWLYLALCQLHPMSHFSSDLWNCLLFLPLLGIELRMSGLSGKCFVILLSCCLCPQTWILFSLSYFLLWKLTALLLSLSLQQTQLLRGALWHWSVYCEELG